MNSALGEGLRIYIGLDEREPDATRAAAVSLRKVCGIQPEILYIPKLVAQGLIARPIDHRGAQDYDLVSNAHQSTRFAICRFLVPILCQQQWALFVDADTIFLRDPLDMLLGVSTLHAVNVVQHAHYSPGPVKMVNQKQDAYPRKNWSSVMLFNCTHPANKRLSLRDINERPGRDLHGFYWLHESEIGALPMCWNWLVDVVPKPDNLGIAHFTLGGPFTKGWPGGPHDNLWTEAASECSP